MVRCARAAPTAQVHSEPPGGSRMADFGAVDLVRLNPGCPVIPNIVHKTVKHPERKQLSSTTAASSEEAKSYRNSHVLSHPWCHSSS